eukprot:m.186751 g.186751  ORF g.186751 m.186751 type:complete len:175 (+) comp39354_c0_seq80:430-954(+)
MFLFEGRHGSVLYSGDFRLTSNDVQKMNHLHLANGCCKKIRTMYLDTTFLHPKLMDIPRREESRSVAMEILKKWKDEDPDHLAHLNCNSLGYEHVLTEAAEKFNTKIHVHPSTFARYADLPNVAKCLTVNPRAAWIHACSWKVIVAVTFTSKRFYSKTLLSNTKSTVCLFLAAF